ncbi:aldehyde dehydrogenase family protein [Xanthomonas sp. NCPPB 2654]|uniref:aldehyde dehydrogenase family protein n=1 Tax=unclassified Xanthomonas TaxID=2643310 RepID=UPI0021E0EB0C|nr:MULTISPECIES: aldehyde dehydrogenase family protein [unclassified Xanthomonas]MDL5364224.1 aldehyde dehydrogenase family protein [Xanthomonas sp. NCPPB 2654]UYC20477.1 aldehyde dehydrogenase family protein [Xanthomonas sp. CFBP 8443]
MTNKYKILVDGKLVDGPSSIDVINPASGKVFATCARADEQLLNQAVSAAKRAFSSWSTLKQEERKIYLNKLADALQARQQELTELLTREQGKPLSQAGYEVAGSIAILRFYASFDLPLHIRKEAEDGRILEQRIPLGVVAAITPWNFPLALLFIKIGPALSAGNTMVAKPAPTTPLTTALLGEIAANILPPGVLNVIVDANDLGSLLTSHPDVAKVAFTGSTATGKRVMESAAATVKRLTLELGGNDAAIILDDADVKEVAPKVFNAAMLNAGQVCLAAKRIYAPRSLHDALCSELAKLANEAVVGDGFNPDTQIGPLQNRQQFEKVLALIEDARSHGTVIAGGAALPRDGFFIQPTVVRDLHDDVRLVREEQFGPVIPILSYETEDEVVRRVNDSEYGLGCTIWTSNAERGARLALRVESGTVWVNKHFDIPLDVPYGGAKESGIGLESGIEGIEAFTQVKIINIANKIAS